MTDVAGAPPNEPPADPPGFTDADADSLRGFVYELRALVDEVVENGRFVPEQLREHFRDAWREVREGCRELVDFLSDLDQTAKDRLRDHGLSGASLKMKLRGWRTRLFDFGQRMDRPWLRSVLRWGETLLETFADAVPFGAGKAVKEVVMSLGNGLDDVTDRSGSNDQPPPPRSEDLRVAVPGTTRHVILDLEAPDSSPPG